MWLKATTPLITGWVPPASSSHPPRVTSLAHEAPFKSLISSCVWNQRLRPNTKTEDALVTRFYKGVRSSVSGTGGGDQTCISSYVTVTKISYFWELAIYPRKKIMKPTRFDKSSKCPLFVNDRIKTSFIFYILEYKHLSLISKFAIL